MRPSVRGPAHDGSRLLIRSENSISPRRAPRCPGGHRTQRPPPQERIAILRRLGLSPYQAKVYVALVEAGLATAGRLAKLSGVPRGRIYQVLETLTGAGLAAVSPEKPAQFSALPLGDYIERHAADLRRRARELDGTVLNMADAIAEAREKPGGVASPRVFLLRGSRAVGQRIREMVRGALTAVWMQATPAALVRAPGNAERLVTSENEASLDIRLVLGVSAGEDVATLRRLSARARSGALRVSEATGAVSSVIADGSRLLIWSAGETKDGAADVGIWTDDPGVVRGFASQFEIAWGAGAEPDRAMRRLASGAQKGGFVLFRSAREAAARLRSSVQKSEEEVLDLTSGARLTRRAEGLIPRKQIPRNLRVRGLTHVTSENAGNLEGLPDGFQVRHLPQDLGLRFTVIDSKETFVYRPIAPGESGGDPFEDTLHSDDPEVAKVYRNVFEHLWSQSSSLKDRLGAIASGGAGGETRIIRDLDKAFETLGDAVAGPWKELRAITIAPALAAGAALFSVSSVGKRVRIILHITPEVLPVVREIAAKGAEVRHLPFDLGLRSVGIDLSSTFILQGGLFSGADEAALEDEESMLMIHSTEPGFAEVQSRLHATLWSMSVPWEVRAKEIEQGVPLRETLVFHDPQAAMSAIGGALGRLRDELLSVTTGPGLIRSLSMYRGMLDAMRGKLRSRVLLRIDSGTEEVVRELLAGGVEVRHLPFDAGLRMTVFDRREVFILPNEALLPPIPGTDDTTTSVTFILSSDPAIAQAFARHHAQLWEAAMPAEVRLLELAHEVRSAGAARATTRTQNTEGQEAREI